MNTPLRILHVIPSLGPLRGGPSVAARAIAAALAAAGHSVEVVATDDNGPGRLDVPLHRPIVEGGVRYRYFPRQSRFYTGSAPLAAWLAANVARYDVVHAHALFSFAPLVAAAAAAARGVPYLVRPLGTLSPYGLAQKAVAKRLSLALFDRHALAGAAAVHFTSQQECDEAAVLAIPHRPAIIPLPVALTGELAPLRGRLRTTYPALANRTVALALGRVDPKKGFDLLLPALAAARRTTPELALLVAGDGEPRYLAELQASAAALGLGPQDVIWAGFVSGEAKLAALADADLFVLPSYAENFAIAAVEAMAAGLPLLLSDQVGIHHEVTSAGAGLITPCAVEPLAAALTTLAADEALRARMGEAGRRLAAERYAPEPVAAQLVALYRSLVQRTPRTATYPAHR